MKTLTKKIAAVATAVMLCANAASAASVYTYVSAYSTINADPADGYRPGAVGGIDFAGQILDFTAYGNSYYGGYSYSSTADGRPENGLIEGIVAHSLVGIFSSTSNAITAIGSRFLVGTSLTALLAPTTGPAYLFLGYNDNYFGDNAGGFSAIINYEAAPVSAVPLPAGGMLLVSALGAAGIARRRSKAA